MRTRWRHLHDVGHDPDYRFSLANERTFLAWIRTALALDAAGLGIVALLPPLYFPLVREVLGFALVAAGTVVAFGSYLRWYAYERALRTEEPLPPSRMPPLLAGVIGVASLAVVVLLLVAQWAQP